MPLAASHWAHITPSVGMSALATVKQYSLANRHAPVQPTTGTLRWLTRSWIDRELSEIIGPRITTQPSSHSHSYPSRVRMKFSRGRPRASQTTISTGRS